MRIGKWCSRHREEIRVPQGLPWNRLLAVDMYGTTLPDPEYCYYYHHKQHHVLEYVVSGRGFIETDGECHTVEAGDFYFIRGGFAGSWHADPAEPYEKIWINCYGSLIDGIAGLFGFEGSWFICRDAVRVGEKMRALHAMLDAGGSDDEEIVRSVSTALFDMLAATVGASAFKEERPTDDLCERMKLYMKSRIYDGLSLDNLAEQFHLNRSYLVRRFKADAGITPIRYFNSERINAAKDMLLRGNTVGFVAKTLGYADAAYFSGCFREQTGMSPTEFVRQGVTK